MLKLSPNHKNGLFSQRSAGGSGDPHFVTHDGLEFTFNGLGEFVLLRIEEINFEIQVKKLIVVTSFQMHLKETKCYN